MTGTLAVPSVTLPRVMGHRGAAGLAPENTLSGLRRAMDLGLAWVEFDVMLSGDDVPMLFHDDSLKRTTGRDALMAETPRAALAELEAGAWFDPAFTGEAVPTLEEALDYLQDEGIFPNIEIKPSKARDLETAEQVVQLVRRVWRRKSYPPLFSSFSQLCLEVARDGAPQWPRSLIALTLPENWEALGTNLGFSSIHLRGSTLSGEQAAIVKQAGYQLAAFTINDAKQARGLYEIGVDCIITDRPDLILKSTNRVPEISNRT